MLFLVQTVQVVKAVQTPSFILPRVAGEESGGDLNRVKRLNQVKRLSN
jgi:hypothetical protein